MIILYLFFRIFAISKDLVGWCCWWMVIFDGWTKVKVTASLLEVNNEIRGRPSRDVGNVAGEK
jgi:hypothetical protein